MADSIPIPDVQATADRRRIAIHKVGIKDIRHPVRVKDRSAGEQHTVASFAMYVALPQDFKGTHMSRFVEILNAQEFAISIESFEGMLDEVVSRLQAESAHIAMSFPYFVEKHAPVTGAASLMDYAVTLHGAAVGGGRTIELEVRVPVATVCPCSKQISDRGAHNQRSHVTVRVEPREFVWIEELIELVEGEASSPLWGVLKRPDEKWVTEHGYDHPKFVEDLARDVAARLRDDPRIVTWQVEVENFESIHNHSAYAMIRSEG